MCAKKEIEKSTVLFKCQLLSQHINSNNHFQLVNVFTIFFNVKMELTFSVYSIKYSQTTDINYFSNHHRADRQNRSLILYPIQKEEQLLFLPSTHFLSAAPFWIEQPPGLLENIHTLISAFIHHRVF